MYDEIVTMNYLIVCAVIETKWIHTKQQSTQTLAQTNAQNE